MIQKTSYTILVYIGKGERKHSDAHLQSFGGLNCDNKYVEVSFYQSLDLHVVHCIIRQNGTHGWATWYSTRPVVIKS